MSGFVSLFPVIALAVGLYAGRLLAYGGWQESAQCQRCGHVHYDSDLKVWGRDKTCPSCGPRSTWKRVTARASLIPFVWGVEE